MHGPAKSSSWTVAECARQSLRLTLSQISCLVSFRTRGSTTVAGMPLRLSSSNASSPLPPAMSRTPEPDARRSLPKVSSRNLHGAQHNQFFCLLWWPVTIYCCAHPA